MAKTIKLTMDVEVVDYIQVGKVTKDDKGRLVYIISGNYHVDGRISNFWEWKRIIRNGQLGAQQYHGYGWKEARD